MKVKAKSLLARVLNFISFGKYQTILYSEKTGRAYSSSILGGLVTVFLLLIIGGAITQ